MHVRQGEAKGLGHAVLKASPIIDNELFVVVLPDVILDEASADLKTENLSAMLTVTMKSAVIAKLWLNLFLWSK